MVENRKFFNDPEYIIPFFSEVISRMGWKLVIDRRNSPPCVLPALPLPLQNTSASCALSVRKKKKKKKKRKRRTNTRPRNARNAFSRVPVHEVG